MTLPSNILLNPDDLAVQTNRCTVRIHVLKPEYEEPVLKALEATDLHVKSYAHFTKPTCQLWCSSAYESNCQADCNGNYLPSVSPGQALPDSEITTIQILIEFKKTLYVSKFASMLHERIQDYLYNDIMIMDKRERAIIVMQIQPWMTNLLTFYEYHFIAGQAKTAAYICDACPKTPLTHVVIGVGTKKRKMTYETDMRCEDFLYSLENGSENPHLYNAMHVLCGSEPYDE